MDRLSEAAPARPGAASWLQGHPRLRSELRTAVLAWLVARVLVLAGWIVAIVIADEFIPDRAEFLRRNPWNVWDGGWYAAIAGYGYENVPGEAIRFFPLYPLAARTLDVVLPGSAIVPLVLLSNAAALAAAVLVQRFVLAEGWDRVTAERSAWVLTLFPASFVLVLPYAEPFFLVFGMGAFTLWRTGRWWPAGAAGVLAGLSRPTGVLLAIPAAIDGWRARDAPILARLSAVAGPIVGCGIHLLMSERVVGNWAEPIDQQRPYRGDFVDPFTRLYRAVGGLAGSERLGDGLHVPFAVGFVVLAVLSWWWLSTSAAVYSTALVVVALSAENLNSLERYALNAFPLLLVIAVLVRHPVADRIWTLISAGGLVALTSLGWLSQYVP